MTHEVSQLGQVKSDIFLERYSSQVPCPKALKSPKIALLSSASTLSTCTEGT
jgi:hypothetical protein